MDPWDPVDVIAHQRAMNGETWRTLVAHRVTEDTELVLEFMYLADSRSDADALAAFLRNETDYEIEAKDGAVEGSTQPTTVGLAALNTLPTLRERYRRTQ